MMNIHSRHDSLASLKAQLEVLDRSSGFRRTSNAREHNGEVLLPLGPNQVHEFYAAAPADAVAVNAFGLGMAMSVVTRRPIVWGVHEMMAKEAGRPHALGLHQMGHSAHDLLVVMTRDVQVLLAVGEEALRSSTVGAVLLSAWGDTKAFSLTASRRLALAAKNGGTTLFIARARASPSPSAAETRWSVSSSASKPLEGGAPGRPSFSATLLRRRGGGEPKNWILEWDRDARSFREPAPLSGAVVPVAVQRPAEAWGDSGRRVA